MFSFLISVNIHGSVLSCTAMAATLTGRLSQISRILVSPFNQGKIRENKGLSTNA